MSKALSTIPEEFKELLQFRPATPPLSEGSWFGGIAIYGTDGQLHLVSGKLILLECGLYPPDLPPGCFIHEEGVVAAATSTFSEEQTLEILHSITSSATLPSLIQKPFNTSILPSWVNDTSHTRWHINTNIINGNLSSNKISKTAYRHNSRDAKDYISEEIFNSADTAFRFMDHPMAGINDFAKHLNLLNHHSFRDRHSIRGSFEICAELPLSVDDFSYSNTHNGYRIKVSIGARLPREQFKFSITGPLSLILPLNHIDWKQIGGDETTTLVFECILTSEHHSVDIDWQLALGGKIIGKGLCTGRPTDAFWSESRKFSIPPLPQTINLPYGEWVYFPDKKLGNSGGFGEVFEGTDSSKRLLAIKRIKTDKGEYAQREVQVVREFIGQKHAHIIPIFDAGYDAKLDSHFIVMARAQQNLQDFIIRAGSISEKEAIPILESILFGLEELGSFVHRDLKPANILFHENAWKLADFGLTRAVDAATATHTVKGFLTSDYAAPEQWRGERASSKTDIYAFGCIIFTLLNGHPPFRADEDLQSKHIHQAPDFPLKGTKLIQALAAGCLSKAPDMRPSIIEIRQLLRIALEPGSAEDPIVSASAMIMKERNQRETEKIDQEQKRTNRKEAARTASLAFQARVKSFFQDIVDKSAGVAGLTEQGNVILGTATLIIEPLGFEIPEKAFLRSGWDVLTGFSIILAWRGTQESHMLKYFSANVWFARKPNDPTYRWWEVGFLSDKGGDLEHFGTAVAGHLSSFDLTMAGEPSEFKLANPPSLADLEAEPAFFYRWRKRLADASRSLVTPYTPSW